MHLEFGVKEQVVFTGNFTISYECWSKLIDTGVYWRTSSFEAHCIVRRCHPLLYHIEVPLPLCHNRDLLLLQTDNVIFHVLGEGIQPTADVLMPKVFFQKRKRLLQLAFLFPVCNHAQTRGHNREGKLLRHVVMVAKFLDDNKPKIHLKSKFALFQTSSMLFTFI